MRLDKFLKISRLIKRRTVANELVSGGHVAINGKLAKPSALVKQGDELTIRFGSKLIRARIEQVPEKAPPAQLADTLYTILDETQTESVL